MGKIKEEAGRGKRSKPLHRMYYNSPIGKLCLEDDGEALTALYPVEAVEPDESLKSDESLKPDADMQPDLCSYNHQDPLACQESELLQHACEELDEYFSGIRETFDIPLHPQGTEFQKKVWNALREIPFGETRSYADIAEWIGQPNACRAVGGANNKNRILIMIPCHRVIGKDGSMTGFGCGIHAKEYLLRLEHQPAKMPERQDAQDRESEGKRSRDEDRNDVLSEAELAYEYIPEEEGEFYRTGKYTLKDYYAIPQERRVELIDGHIYDMAAPGTVHQFAVAEITFQFELYVHSKGGNCRVYPSPVDVQLDCDDKTMVQPDVVVVCDRDKIKKRCLYGAPDLLVEILSDSTAYKDTVVKLCKYMQAGVREYWIVDLKREKVTVYDATGGSRADTDEADVDAADANVSSTNVADANVAGENRAGENRAGISCRTTIYGMDQPIPVQIFDGNCQISFDEIREEARRILNSSEDEE